MWQHRADMQAVLTPLSDAIKLAEKAFSIDEVPIGAIIICFDRIIGKGYNQCESLNDATAHAEIIAITSASNYLQDWRLNDCVMYVTMEPCSHYGKTPPCVKSIINSGIRKVFFSINDPDPRSFKKCESALRKKRDCCI